MAREYVHQALGEEVTVPSGYYRLLKELRLRLNGGDVLCITGVGMVERSGCVGDCIAAGRGGPYAFVPGNILSWKAGTNEAGLAVSEVEPISDEATRQEIARIIRETEGIENIEFWGAKP